MTHHYCHKVPYRRELGTGVTLVVVPLITSHTHTLERAHSGGGYFRGVARNGFTGCGNISFP